MADKIPQPAGMNDVSADTEGVKSFGKNVAGVAVFGGAVVAGLHLLRKAMSMGGVEDTDSSVNVEF